MVYFLNPFFEFQHVVHAYELDADATTYIFTGSTGVQIRHGYLLAESTTYTFAGTDAALHKVQIPLVAGAGVYAFQGSVALLEYNFRITAGQGTYTFVGAPITLKRTRKLVAGGGSYSFSGTDAALAIGGRKLVAVGGSYAFSGTAASFAIVAAPGVGPHRYWRSYAMADQSGNAVQAAMAEIEMRATTGSADQLSGGTATASEVLFADPGTYGAPKAVDANNATFYSGWASGTDGLWWSYDFGSGNDKSVTEVAVRAAASPNHATAPKALFFGYSDTGTDSTFAIAFGVTSQTGWTTGEQRVFTDPDLDGSASHRYWAVATMYSGSTALYIATLEMRATASGADQCSGGTALGDRWATSAASNAFDADGTTSAQKFGFSGWIGYDFGSAKTVVEVAIKARSGFYLTTPFDFTVMCSDDGINWSPSWTVHTTWLVADAGTQKVFTKP